MNPRLLCSLLLGVGVLGLSIIVQNGREVPVSAKHSWNPKQELAQNLNSEPARIRAPTAEQKAQLPRSQQFVARAPMTEFDHWIDSYLRATGSVERAKLIESGKRLAIARRDELKRLIPADPRSALESAVPVVLRQQLPVEILALLEERVNTRGNFRVMGVSSSAEQAQAPVRRIVDANGKRYQAYVYGERLSQVTTQNAFLTGIAVDHLFAVDERRLRVLERGEKPDSSKPIVDICPISGISTEHDSDATAQGQAPVVEAGGVIHYLCSGGHIIQFERQLAALEGGTGGPIRPGTLPLTTTSTGVKTCLYLRLAFPETRQEPQTEADAYAMMEEVNDWYVAGSYGNLYLLTTVSPLIVLPRTEAFYTGGDGNEYDLYDDALTTAASAGYDCANYDLCVVAYSGGPGNFNGLGNIGSPGVWLKSFSAGVAAHEIGHNLGLWHANAWDTGGRSIIGDGTHVEYGNSFDTMGISAAGNFHFNAVFKNQLEWLTNDFVHDIRTSGTYRIYAYDQPQLDPAKRYAFHVRKDNTRSYWGEFRQLFGSSNPCLRDGILLNWTPWAKSNGGTHLLDTTPGSPNGVSDAALTIGRTFSDLTSGVHITPIGKGGSSPESIDVVVNLGAFPGNLAPGIVVNAAQTNVNPNVPVTLTASANDPDGDALAYFWDFGDSTFSNDNAPNEMKSWSVPGDYPVRCVVSDMKGGTASANVVIHVGSPNTFTISGHIIANNQAMANVRVDNGLAGVSYRGAYTDSNGDYTITGVPAGAITLNATLYGYNLSPVFQNPLNVNSNVSGANFSGSLLPSVTLSVPDSDAAEGSNQGKFTVTRTGSTASPLTVAFLAPSGTASRISDYQLNPALTFDAANQWYTVTVPAGQSSKDILLTANSDGTVEGLETATLEMVPASNYTNAGNESATVYIQDADSALPLVSLNVLNDSATEFGNPAKMTISRTGSLANSLAVNVVVTGSATNGGDYASIAQSIVIPAGKASEDIIITPIQDNIVEGDEDVTISLGTTANYLINPTEQTARCVIVDDDMPLISITAADVSASEAGQDPATFVVTRTGSPSLPLTVNYALSGSAEHGVDYAILPGVLTIPAGSNAASITIVPIDDAIGEPDQTVSIQLRGGTGYIVGPLSSANAVILDNDKPVVTVGVAEGVVGEPQDGGQFRFQTTGSGPGNVTIHYTVSGTANAGSDYVSLPGILSMGRNGTVTLPVSMLDDGLPENLETITITIDPDPAYTTFLDKNATMNLVDNERCIINVAASNTYFDEGNGGTMDFHFSRLGSDANAVTIHYTMSGTATNGSDYLDLYSNLALSGTVTIAAGQRNADVYAKMVNDTSREGTETAILTITSDAAYGLGIATATQYITDNDIPTVSVKFNTAIGSGAESIGTVNIPVTLSSTSTSVVTVEYAMDGGSATGGIDYQLGAGLLTFNPGVTSQTIPLAVLNDSWNEPPETVVIHLKNPWHAGLGTSAYTFTVNDDDSPPPVSVGFASISSSGGENVSPAVLLVSLSAPQNNTVSVHYSATNEGSATGGGVDFSLSPGTLIFAPGETIKPISLSIVHDAVSESDETVVVALDNPTGAILGANTKHTFTIHEAGATFVTVTDPADQTITDQQQIALHGLASDSQGIQSVTVNGVSATTNNGFATWSAMTNLVPGWNQLMVVATNQANPSGSASVTRQIFYAAPNADTDHDGMPDSWEFQNGLDLFDNGSILGRNGAMGDPDCDGLNNLEEFAFNRNPNLPDQSIPWTFGIQTNAADGKRYLTVTYPRRFNAVTLLYIPEASGDLVGWDGSASSIESIGPPVPNPDGITETVAFRIKPAVDTPGVAKKVFRIRLAPN